ncbi:hypothetical protein GY065_09445 [Snodgrassella sp. ESL0323]|uniref:hypothetical protein n=1 Tax=Snodgrassella sp. ESL0323 TaxID=2705034 RepID=UPI0015822899|nr:hypothetical protein [Snodgrassella sp. ESL0323]NUF79126.1 hypothetical protein [Snodgrassella sp. ESL0323]
MNTINVVMGDRIYHKRIEHAALPASAYSLVAGLNILPVMQATRCSDCYMTAENQLHYFVHFI